jgi:hypothetical protein
LLFAVYFIFRIRMSLEGVGNVQKTRQECHVMSEILSLWHFQTNGKFLSKAAVNAYTGTTILSHSIPFSCSSTRIFKSYLK